MLSTLIPLYESLLCWAFFSLFCCLCERPVFTFLYSLLNCVFYVFSCIFPAFQHCRWSSSTSNTAVSGVITAFLFSMKESLLLRKHLNSSSQGAYSAHFHQRERWGNCPTGWGCNLCRSLLKPSLLWFFQAHSRCSWRLWQADLPLLGVPLA